MADPTGTVGGASSRLDSDLALISRGGPTFVERLEQFAAAADRHEQAFAKLKIGQDAVAALDEAQRKLAEAGEMHKQAARTLADAQSKAKAQLAEAKADADRTVADADALKGEADKRLAQVQAREAAAEQAIAKAERAEAEANRLRTELQRKIDYLRTQVREIAAA
jgi:chromosome segregation ATPase